MSTRTQLRLPQVSSNETTATLLEWMKSEGEIVRSGEIICAVETTKSVFEVEADSEGRLFPLLDPGETAGVGQPIAVLSTEAHDSRTDVLAWLENQLRVEAAAATTGSGTAGEARPYTKKAEILALRHQVDLSRVQASGDRITEADVEAYLRLAGPAPAGQDDLADDVYPAGRVERILILGGGDGAVQVLDTLAKIPGQRGVAILDDNPELAGRRIMGVPVSGPMSINSILKLRDEGAFDAAIISISTLIPIRRRLFDECTQRGIRFTNVIHPTTCQGSNVALGQGNVILAFCHLGACATVGNNNFLSAYVSIEHHGRLGHHCSFGPGVLTSSRVDIGDGTRFGTGIFIEPKLKIGAGSVISSGVILRNDLVEGSVVKARLNQVFRHRSPIAAKEGRNDHESDHR